MSGEIPNLLNPEGPNQDFELFTPGNLIHVGRLSRINQILQEGLYSPAAQARKQGRRVVNPGFWFPNDNLVVKFLKFESPLKKESFHALRDHFEMFGELDDDRAIGFIVQRTDATRLAEGEPYFGIEDVVPSADIRGIVLPVIPMLRQDVANFTLEVNLEPAQKILDAVRNAQSQQTISEAFVLVDHFGRKITSF